MSIIDKGFTSSLQSQRFLYNPWFILLYLITISILIAVLCENQGTCTHQIVEINFCPSEIKNILVQSWFPPGHLIEMAFAQGSQVQVFFNGKWTNVQVLASVPAGLKVLFSCGSLHVVKTSEISSRIRSLEQADAAAALEFAARNKKETDLNKACEKRRSSLRQRGNTEADAAS